MFKPLFTVTGLFALIVGVLLFVAPDIYLSLYIADVTPDMRFAGQRLSPAVAGLGILLLIGRDLPAGPFAAQFATITALVWFAIAATGVFHFATGVATQGVLIAGLTEVVTGVLFLIAARQARRQ